ncbi:MAG: polysaccharide biosynthesis tyrosine autokinase [Verrucomicrobia bacterium]|nr:polysaccharide biosynthesis tyrosine autokinase [Verrucomicrobiota bacterium]MDA1067766.1 polysaccharide biosynthesis tyrosine autokinase [Verrucomicrobiota bacterium]
MDRSIKKESPDGRGYYNYDSGYHQGGYGGDSGHQRSLQDYLLIIRERIWWILVIFVLVQIVTTLVILSQTQRYKSISTVEVKREANRVVQFEQVDNQDMRGTEDFNTQVGILESNAIIEQVSNRLKGNERERFIQPYLKNKDPSEISIGVILFENRKIIPKRLTRIIAVEFVHPDPELAAKVANLFVDEYIGFNQRKQLEASLKAVEDLRIRADQQRSKLEELEFKLQEYREKHHTVSFDERSVIENEKLRVLNLKSAEAEAFLYEIESRWSLVEQYRSEKKDLLSLSFISNNPLVQKLNSDLSTATVEVALLSKRYREKHPTMIGAMRSFQEVQDELAKALQTEVDKVYSDLLQARTRDQEAKSAVESQETLLLGIDRLSVDYETIQREAEVNTVMYQTLVSRMRETNISSSLDNANARVLDRAGMALEPYWPNYFLFFGAGIIGGCILGLGVAFIISFLDDRVKSIFDIESVIGVPLLGIISEVKNLPTVEKAKMVNSSIENQASEGFRALHSSLKLKAISKEAQCFMITSTIPSEGKTFISTNLAFTFASHGDRTLLIDCDMRLPNVAKSLGLNNELGVIDYCYEKATFDEIVKSDTETGLDLITTGGRANNPSQILSSSKFEEFLQIARSRYERIIIDTPPLSAVSDSLLILPLVDGVLYTIKFNAVNRKAILVNMRRLVDSEVPVFGSVLNSLKLSVSGYYYSYQYHRYKDYYHHQVPKQGERV